MDVVVGSMAREGSSEVGLSWLGAVVASYEKRCM